MTAVDEKLVVTEPGVYDGLPDEVYHADPVPGGSLSSSGARLLLPPSCPALYQWRRANPEQRRVFDLGKAAHKLVLGTGPELSVVDAPDWRTKAAKEARAAAYEADLVPVLEHEFQAAEGMAAALADHPLAAALFDRAHGSGEQSLFWRDDQMQQVWRRARLDWLPQGISSRGRMVIPDYKTCARADRESVRKSAATYGYHQQAAWYCDAARALLGAPDVAFLFVFQERTPPYLVNVVELDVVALRIGHALNREAITTYARCVETGNWHGYAENAEVAEVVALPPWVENQHKEKTW